ncbi:MAG: universal stress protein, partial [Candidatus Obscuribacterales bacterium]
KWSEDDSFVVVTVAQLQQGIMLSGVPAGPAHNAEIRHQAYRTACRDAEAVSSILSGNTVDIRVLPGSPAEAICQEARDVGADLIIMGSHGREGFSRLFLGSVAEDVLKQAPCSVAVIKELQDPGESEQAPLVTKAEFQG